MRSVVAHSDWAPTSALPPVSAPTTGRGTAGGRCGADSGCGRSLTQPSSKVLPARAEMVSSAGAGCLRRTVRIDGLKSSAPRTATWPADAAASTGPTPSTAVTAPTKANPTGLMALDPKDS